KLGSSGLKSICMLAAFLPMLMIPVLAGGVTGGEALREGLVLLNTFWFSLCAGLWTSARSDEAFRAIRTTCFVVGTLVFIPYILSYSAGIYFKFSEPTWAYVGLTITALLSPLATLGYARDTFYINSVWPFWVSLAIVQGLAWLLLFFA